jgi:hypothetical protein
MSVIATIKNKFNNTVSDVQDFIKGVREIQALKQDIYNNPENPLNIAIKEAIEEQRTLTINVLNK